MSKNNAFIAFILEDIFIIKLLFQKYKTYKYNKNYNGFNKKKTIHSIYINQMLQ